MVLESLQAPPLCSFPLPSEPIELAENNVMPTAEKIFFCEICSAKFRFSAVLRLHMKRRHAALQPVPQQQDSPTIPDDLLCVGGRSCISCNLPFASWSALETHFLTEHEPEHRGFACGFCGKTFRKCGALKQHFATHTSTTVYTCPHCQRPFNRKDNMFRHMSKSCQVRLTPTSELNSLNHSTSSSSSPPLSDP